MKLDPKAGMFLLGWLPGGFNHSSSGFMYPTNDVRIMKDGDNEALLGEDGEIWGGGGVRGPSIMKGYFGDPGTHT